MNQVIGDFQEVILEEHELFSMNFCFHALPANLQKRTRYLSVAFISDYLSYLFPPPEDDPIALEKHLELKSATTYITNELLENSTKFNNISAKHPVQFSLGLRNSTLSFITQNSVTPHHLKKLQAFIEELSNSDPNEFYFNQLEKGAAQQSEESGLGLVSTINDYRAKLGWKFKTVRQDPEIVTVITMVQLDV